MRANRASRLVVIGATLAAAIAVSGQSSPPSAVALGASGPSNTAFASTLPPAPTPVPITGDSDTGPWTTGIPVVTSAASALPASSSARATAAADLTWSIRARLSTRGRASEVGSATSGQVVDAATGRVLWSKNPSIGRAPASNQKLVTALVALVSLGESTRFTTPVLQVPSAPATVYLKGSGDPALSSGQLATMANAVATKVKGQGRSSVAVVVDDSLFPAPTNAAGWKPEWIPGTVAPVRALVVDQVNVLDTSLQAGQVFAARLRSAGITASSVTRGRAPAGAATIASTTSPTVAQLVQTMLNASQTDYAEGLHRLSAIKRGFAPDWAGARSNALAVLASRGINSTGLVVNDGSGLSQTGRMTPVTAIDLVSTVRATPALNSVMFAAAGVPTSGVSGTLANRYRSAPTSCARSLVRAKTGTLATAIALSGVASGVDGRERVFSVIINGVTSTSAARADVDALAATATGCY